MSRFTLAECISCLECAAEAALDIILVADDHRRFVDVNEAAAKALELPRNEIVVRRIDEFFTMTRGETVAQAGILSCPKACSVGRVNSIEAGIGASSNTGPKRTSRPGSIFLSCVKCSIPPETIGSMATGALHQPRAHQAHQAARNR